LLVIGYWSLVTGYAGESLLCAEFADEPFYFKRRSLVPSFFCRFIKSLAMPARLF